MNRIFALLLLMLSIAVSMRAQSFDDIPQDSLPNLWVVTVDMSGSMTEHGYYKTIVSRLMSMMENHGLNQNRDKVMLLYSGINQSELRSSSAVMAKKFGLPYKEKNFSLLLIRKGTDEPLDYRSAMEKLKKVCSMHSSFSYDQSFTSLVRPLSIYVLAKAEKMDFKDYNNVYHVLVTDDGDTNDQWSMDYKYLSKFYNEHFLFVKKVLPSVACSDFDFISQKTGKFEEVSLMDDQPYVYLTRYTTFQDKYPGEVEVDSLVSVEAFNDTVVTLKMKGKDAIKLMFIDEIRVNDSLVVVKDYLYPQQRLSIPFDKAFSHPRKNRVSLSGYCQEVYVDRVLGLRERKVPVKGQLSGFYTTLETKHKDRKTLLALAAVMVAAVIAFLLWFNAYVLHIRVNGKRWSIKRKAMNRLKHDNYVLATVFLDENGLVDAAFYKGNGIRIVDDDDAKDEDKLYIKSKKSLAIDCPNLICNTDRKDKHAAIVEFSSQNVGDAVHFQFANRLSHNLTIEFVMHDANARVIKKVPLDSYLRECNLKMLAKYYEVNADSILSPRNNVMVNIIKKKALRNKYANDFAILNIFDLNSQNQAHRIYLRYSMMCFYDESGTADAEVTEMMLKRAEYVLKSERQPIGYVEKTAFADTIGLKSWVEVDVSPMLSYLYLLASGKKRLVYSPFRDGCMGLTHKTISVFPNKTMTLLNLPIKHAKPEIKIDDSQITISINGLFKKTEPMVFQGSDEIRFVNEIVNYSYGQMIHAVNGDAVMAWKLDDIIFECIKNK